MYGMRNAVVAALATAALFVVPNLAEAAQGFIVQDTTLRAGPDEQFPAVDQVAAGTAVDVNGCLSGHSWCDISFSSDRGWVSGEDLEIMLQGKRIKISTVTVQAIPVVSFEIRTYWEQHYKSRPFFAERDRFASININIGGGKKAPPETGANANVNVNVNKKGAAAEAAPKTGANANANLNAGNKPCPPDQKNCPSANEKAAGATPKAGGAGSNEMGANAKGAGDMGAMGAATPDENARPGASTSGGGVAEKKGGCTPGTKDCPAGGKGGGG